MLMWHPGESVEVAALQLLNVLFAVPQLSVRLAEIPEDHLEMVRFWTGYWRENREVLLDGEFTARAPLANYPLVSARGAKRTIIVAYADMVVPVSASLDGAAVDVVNAKASRRIVLDVDGDMGTVTVRTLDAMGATASPEREIRLDEGVHAFDVPLSGLLEIRRK
jgi:alpha-galactosidase